MQATDPFHSGPSLLAEGGVSRLKERLIEMRQEVGREEWKRIQGLVADPERDHESIRDAVSTRLMEVFKDARAAQSECRGAFGLLYELNGQHLLTQVAARLRRYSSKADPRDVLQEVFFNVYRYPHRFNSAREDAFRVWSAMIVRNTVLKHLRSLSRGGRSELNFEDVPEQSSGEGDSPVAGAIETESRDECARVFVTYLQLYLQFYSMLSERERRALHLVEVDEQSYRQASEELGIKLENLKMVIFRARRKIHRSMRRVFEGLSPDCRPARDPRTRGTSLESTESTLTERGSSKAARASEGGA